MLIPALNHLILSFTPVEESLQVKIITDNVTSLLYVQNMLTELLSSD